MQSNIINPESAIWNKDIDELSRALSAGWTLPYARVKDGNVVDLTLVIRIISLRWEEGWLLMASKFPWLRTHSVLWQLAIRRAVTGIVKDMLENGRSATEKLESGSYPLKLLAEALGPQPGEPIDEDDLLSTARTLVAAGADPLEPVKGDGDNYSGSEGHTLWTRAVHFGRWGIAGAFTPVVWSDLVAMPKAHESIGDLRRAAVSGDSGALKAWCQFAKKMIRPWLSAHADEDFVDPADLKVLGHLSPEDRELIWERWKKADATGWTPLHDLALLGATPEAHEALALAVKERASCLSVWNTATEDGVRPSDLWEIANRRESEGSSKEYSVSLVPEVAKILG